MIKTLEITGRTEDDAISAALEQLGLERDDISVEIIERAKAGFLGIGGSPARIRVSYEEPDEQEESDDSKTGKLKEFLDGLFKRMDVEADVSIDFDEGSNTISVELSGANMGALIGRRGETLDAIQHLANYVVNSGDSDHTRINIDAENYRAKRADALCSLAKKVAGKVTKYRKNVTLEPMNAYERHVIHTALQDYEGVTTYSTGTEPNRRVVVAYDRPQQYNKSQNRDQNRFSGRESAEKPAQPVEAPAPAKDFVTREWH